jgi:hypothetical protein
MTFSDNLTWQARTFIEVALQDCDDAASVCDFAAGRLYDGGYDCDAEAHAEFVALSQAHGGGREGMIALERLVRQYV